MKSALVSLVAFAAVAAAAVGVGLNDPLHPAARPAVAAQPDQLGAGYQLLPELQLPIATTSGPPNFTPIPASGPPQPAPSGRMWVVPPELVSHLGPPPGPGQPPVVLPPVTMPGQAPVLGYK
ncbi:MAG TPA: hypothetical protein VH682_24645 [Gemmataceae bacterium]